jgi:hypothetical protein
MRPKPSSYQEETQRWVETEFESADLGDGRLNKRLKSIIESFCSLPNGSIPEACGTWAKAKATYRFLRNKRVNHENILEPHRQGTQARIVQEKIVLAIQDTTTLNYTHLIESEGLGYISTSQSLRGMLVHTTLAITPERVPLGVIHQQSWVRREEEYGKKHERRQRPIEDKESQKWLNSLAATEKVQRESPGTLLINVGDREADVYELFQEASRCDHRCHLLVRATQNRGVDHAERYLWSYLEGLPSAAAMEVNVPRKAKKPERIAEVEIRYASVTLKPPRNNPNPHLTPINLWAIYVNESSPPPEEEPICWRLLTTLKVESLQEAMQCVQYYALRFTIELFHKILKSGCAVEKRQLETAGGLMCCLVLDSIIAWRVLFLTMLGRSLPDLPCTALFEEEEWKSLYCFVHKTKRPPASPMTLGEATLMVGRLGGFLGRKRDGHPGAMVIWRGLQKLWFIRASWEAFGPQSGETSVQRRKRHADT